jgi:GH24 family phage-related lysozyme (muramidase)
MRRFSREGREKLTEPWEECVLYVYDDKVPKQHIDGHFRYPEWDGGEPKGTLTVGFGHTNAAGTPKIEQGLRITRDEADRILSNDLAPCERAVSRLLKVEVSGHQYDSLVDTYFDCPKAAAAAIELINAGNPHAVPAKLMQYTFSKGEHMEGLTHRRTAEITWFNTPDDVEAPPALNPDLVFSPKAERNLPPKTMVSSKTGTAAITIGAGAASRKRRDRPMTRWSRSPKRRARCRTSGCSIIWRCSRTIRRCKSAPSWSGLPRSSGGTAARNW